MTGRICSITGCDREHVARGLCGMHYQRMKKPPTTPKPSVADRLWSQVDASGECWVWTGSSQVRGYGMLSDHSRVGANHVLAHRLAWELVNGPIPPGMNVLHRCDNPPCVKVGHLFLGTNADNVADKVEKGRQYRGERHKMTHLTEDDVRTIRADAAQGITARELGERYGMKPHSINQIISRANWKHVA